MHRRPLSQGVVANQLHGTGREGRDYRLVTSLLDARRYPARRLAALYQERWAAEAVFAELKTRQLGAHVVLTGKTPTASCNRSGPTCWSITRCVS